jgi:hypothetical protein
VAYARVVTFEDVDQGRIAELTQRIQEGERPEDIPASEIVVLYDRDAQKSLVTVFFESEDDYRKGDETLSAMDAGETPGRRTSVTKYEVAARRSD